MTLLASMLLAASQLFSPGRTAVGCNYWASNAGIRMWRDWNPAQVERDFDLMASHGIEVVRVFPLWPDFQPLTTDRTFAGRFEGYLQNDGPLKNYAAVDDEMMSRFRFVCDAAERRNIKLIIGLVTGWMSGRMFVPPAFEGLNVVTTPAVVVWQSRYVRYFVERTKDCKSIVAWDFGNECNCMADCDTWQMWLWFQAIGSEIRRADPSRPIVSGLHSMRTDANAKVNMLSIREHVDVVTTHPYPLWTPNCNFEPLNSLRNGCHAPCETTLYSDLTRCVGIVEEAGSLGPCVASERVAADMMRMQLFGSWAAGVPMYMWWCAFDQDKLDYSPYERSTVERELGLFTSEGKAKPTAEELKKFSDFVRSLPFKALPARRTDAVVLVSKRENAWVPSQGAWMLSRQAGFDIRYAYACEPLPESGFYILPSGEGLNAYTRSEQLRLCEKVKNGATALVTLGNGMVLAGLKDFAGVETVSFYKMPRKVEFDAEGRHVEFDEPRTRFLSLCGAKAIIPDVDGNPLMTEFQYGKGKVLLFNGALESNAQIDGWPVYRLAAKIAGVKRRVVSSNPLVCLTEHPRADGSAVVIAINYSDMPKTCALEIDGRVGSVHRGEIKGTTLSIAPNDAAVFEVTEARYLLGRLFSADDSACGRTTQQCRRGVRCMPQEDNQQNQAWLHQTSPMPFQGLRDAQIELHSQAPATLMPVPRAALNKLPKEHRPLPQELRGEGTRLHASSVLLLDTMLRHRGGCSAARHLRQRAFACLASIARAKAPFSSLRLAGSAYCANAPLAVSRRGMAMEIGMERVKTHCRAKMRSASANDVPSSRKSISASFFSSVSMRNCMTVDFVASIDNSLLWSFAHNYTTSVVQMQEWTFRRFAHIVPCSMREAA